MDNVQFILIAYGISAAGSAQARRQAFINGLGEPVPQVVMDSSAIGAFHSIAIDGKLFSCSYEARDWFNGMMLSDSHQRVLCPVGVIVDFQSRYIMLAL